MMVISPKSNDTNLEELLKDVNSGKMQLPEFQRDWTWDDNRIKGIIASLSQGYPMGAIMVLEYGNPQIRFKFRPITGVKTNNDTPDYLILDGQQRLTSIYQSLFSKDVVNTTTDKGKSIKRWYYLSIDECLDAEADRFDAVIAVPEDKKIKQNFDRDIVLDLSSREFEFKNKMFPVNIIFDSKKLMNWTLEFVKYYGSDSEEYKQFEVFNENVVNTISKYKLPVIKLLRETPKEAVCKVFENVNTGGVALTVFELVTATFASDGFDLRKDWVRCRDIIQAKDDYLRTDVLDGIDETSFLTSITLYTNYLKKEEGIIGSVTCKKKDVLSLSLEDYKNNCDSLLEGYKIARDFLLKYQFVFRQRDLPYTTQLIPLAAICAALGKSKCSEPNTIEILSRWYWCGILGEMYGGANETRYANDIEDVINEVEGRPTSRRTINAAFFSSTRLLTLQTRLSAAYKGIMALLYKSKCRDFMNDTTMDIVNSLQQAPDIHHIFPEAYCKSVEIPRSKYNSIVNKTPILLETNRSIGGNAPSVYKEKILSKVSGLSEDELKNRIESHLINYDYLVSDNFDDYFIDRAKKLLNIIEIAMDKSVSDRNSEITIQQFGSSLI